MRPYQARKRQFPPLVERNNNVISIVSLDHPKAVSDFLRCVKSGLRAGFEQFEVNLDRHGAFFPNAVAPIAGIMEFYKEQGIAFYSSQNSTVLNQASLLQPKDYEGESSVLNQVWKFTSSTVGALVSAYMIELQKSAVFQKDVRTAIEWSINEVMDNVLQHSGESYGFVMGQLHSSSEVIAFTVYDSGRGMYDSLKNSIHHPRKALDAITLSMQESVTRDSSIGQGNGLFGLHSIVKLGKGRLTITSSGSSYMYNSGNVTTFDNIPTLSPKRPSTIVDFQYKYSSDVSLEKALYFNGVKYEMPNLHVESMEDELGRVRYSIKDHAEGTGTRIAAERVRNEIMNILQESPKLIILDFKDVSVISSSFADELIAKLLLQLGLYQFNEIIRLTGLEYSLQVILHRSVVQRMLEDYSGNKGKV